MSREFSVFRERIVGIAIEPALAYFRRRDDRMSAGAGVLAGVAIRGRVATEGGAAALAGAQVDPGGVDLDALVTLAAARLPDVANRLDVRTGGGHAKKR